VPLIAETGGLNAMFCDTTALREQVVDDVVMSGFRSAGQRCSALRVLFLPHETADDIIEMIKGAMDVLSSATPPTLQPTSARSSTPKRAACSTRTSNA
jgi:RHH-type proline utilization regulon transcriptional repressor/proline dehydrogenase/delta 1-pyrroline-5-carboxylate dehydrogenase